MNVLILLAFAVAPGFCVALYIYLKDKHEREPLGLLIKSFLLGMLSVVITLLIDIPLDKLFNIDKQDLAQEAIYAFVVVALVEEASKYLFVRGVLFRNQNFNEPFDGIVYSVMVSMGFATLENIMYVVDGGWSVAVLRMFTAIPAHAVFAILMGYYLGLAKFVHHKSHYGWYGLLIATLFHGAYDYFWFIGEVNGVWTGIWIGAIISLAVGVMISKKAIKIHQEASPFQYQLAQEEIKAHEPESSNIEEDQSQSL